MQCCVSFCENTVSTCEGKPITFYKFPSKMSHRTAWLTALDMEASDVTDSTVVCSQHFTNDNIYETESGLKQLHSNAIPSPVRVCMICLDTDSRVLLKCAYQYEVAYTALTGHRVCCRGNLNPAFCVQCVEILINFTRLRHLSMRSYSLMRDLVEKERLITKQNIKMINSTKDQLKYNLVSTTLGPDHCDLYIAQPDEEKETEIEDTVTRDVVVKNEASDSMSGDEDMLLVHEGNNFNFYVSKDDCSDSAIKLETRLLDDVMLEAFNRKPAASCSAVADQVETQSLVEHESASIKSEEFPEEHAYNGHMNMHLQNGDGEHETSQVCEPRTAGSSSSDSSLDNKDAIWRLDDPCTFADLARTLGAPTCSTLATTGESKIHTTENAGTIKIESVHSIINGENNQPCENNQTYTNNIKLTNCIVKLYDILKYPKQAMQDESRNKTRKDISSFNKHNNGAELKNDNYHQAVSHSERNTKNMTKVEKKVKLTMNKFACDICNYKCAQKYNIGRHMRTHTGEKPYTCEVCDYRCAAKTRLVYHMRTHTGEKPYSCALCNYKGTERTRLVRHMRTHTGEKPYSCKICNYKSAARESLAKHMRKHTGVMPYTCEICDYKCAVKGTMVTHMRTHTGEKPFACEICSYKCAASSRLVKHIRTHTGNKPYCCNICNFKCAEYSTLVKHTKTHSGEKPYSCDICNFKCAIKSWLIPHMRTHSDKKPYCCKICNYKGARNSYLLRHMRIHTPQKP